MLQIKPLKHTFVQGKKALVKAIQETQKQKLQGPEQQDFRLRLYSNLCPEDISLKSEKNGHHHQ